MPLIKLLVDGGAMKPGPTVGQQLGPIGINIGEVISKVNQATSEFKGMKVPVVLDINPKTKEFEVEVSSPPTSELLKKEFNIEKGAGDHKKETIANAAIEEIIKVTKVKAPKMLAKDFKSALKSIVGSCATIGILVENKNALELNKDIEKGDFDKEIEEQKTEVSPEKKTKLKKFFDSMIKKQEEAKEAEEAAAKEAEEAKAAEEAAAAAEGEEGATTAEEGEEGAEGATAEGEEGEKPAEEAKPEPKKE